MIRCEACKQQTETPKQYDKWNFCSDCYEWLKMDAWKSVQQLWKSIPPDLLKAMEA